MSRPVETTRPETSAYVGRVVVTDDDQDMSWLIAQALRKDGHGVVEVCDSSDLLELVGSSLVDREAFGPPPDVIVLDVRMSGYDGLSVLANLRSVGSTSSVIIMTALKDPETAASALRLGAAGFFRKPFELHDLRVAVRALVPVSSTREVA
jgi:two-component system, response regulator, stage 0 sporulation protein F